MGKALKRKPMSTRHSGFTLVELMVVIAIIGIIMVIAVPNFTRIQQEARLRGACQRIAQHLKQIRERAISTNGTFQIAFHTPDMYHYTLTRPDNTIDVFRLGGEAGGRIRFGGTGVSGQPPEGTMAAPGVNGNDFPSSTLFLDGRGGANNGVLYITDGRGNYAVGITRLGKVATYYFYGGSWN